MILSNYNFYLFLVTILLLQVSQRTAVLLFNRRKPLYVHQSLNLLFLSLRMRRVHRYFHLLLSGWMLHTTAKIHHLSLIKTLFLLNWGCTQNKDIHLFLHKLIREVNRQGLELDLFIPAPNPATSVLLHIFIDCIPINCLKKSHFSALKQ
jgi:hypothetical protein